MNKRTIVAIMCAIATFICYIDRVNISVAIIPMTEEFGWSGTTKGFVLSSFFIGYMAAMLPTGWLANKYGGRVLAKVETADGQDLSQRLLKAGHARPYEGGKREPWCGERE